MSVTTIGIDLGTTQSKMAFVDPTGKPNIISNARGDESTPTVVTLQDAGPPLVGAEAREQGFLEPDRCAQSFKLALGQTNSVLSNGHLLTPTDACEAVIRKLKQDAEAALGTEITEVAITFPANFRDDSKQALLESFERNGLKVIKGIPEPTAAGIAYALDKGGDQIFLVHDWGGGTFDVSVLRKQGAQVEILATEGVATLGGNDIDQVIQQRVLDELERTVGTRPTSQEDPLFFHDLAVRTEAAKISLGTRPQVPFVASYKGTQAILKLDQDWFHTAIDPLIQKSREAIDKAVAAAGLRMDQINALVMVGGTSRLPYIQQCVAQHTGLQPKTGIDPVKAIAYGAALASVVELAKQGRTASIRGLVIPAPELFLQDVTAHAVGCCVVDASGASRRLLNSVIIPKNTPIPCQKTDSFFLEHDDQTEARIEILQGEPEADRDDCLLIGEVVLDNLPKEQKRSQRIQVEYTIDGNGMVTATATDKVSGKQQSVSVDYKKGIKPKDRPKVA